MANFLDDHELATLGLAACGKGVKISRHALLISPETISIGDDSRIDAFSILSGSAAGLCIGRNVHISAHVTLLGRERIEIADFCTISVRCSLFSSGDDYSGATMTNPTVPAPFRVALDNPVTIGRHAILGAGAIVLPGVTIGESAAVGAHSLVKSDVPPLTIVAGCPARVVGRRSAEHLALEAEFLARDGNRN